MMNDISWILFYLGTTILAMALILPFTNPTITITDMTVIKIADQLQVIAFAELATGVLLDFIVGYTEEVKGE